MHPAAPIGHGRLPELEDQRKLIAGEPTEAPPRPVRFHPNLAAICQAKVEKVRETLERDGARSEAAEIIRGLIAEIRPIPDQQDDAVRVELPGGFGKWRNTAGLCRSMLQGESCPPEKGEALETLGFKGFYDGSGGALQSIP